MASVSQVKAYLAYWFQLGKPVVFHKSQTQCLPNPIFQGSRFSAAFEQCWQQLTVHDSESHLLGTDQTIAQLLAEDWDITDCARCEMPVPLSINGLPVSQCPCADMPLWPNNEVPRPRLPLAESDHLDAIRVRLTASAIIRDRLHTAYQQSPSLPDAKNFESSEGEWALQKPPLPDSPLQDTATRSDD